MQLGYAKNQAYAPPLGRFSTGVIATLICISILPAWGRGLTEQGKNVYHKKQLIIKEQTRSVNFQDGKQECTPYPLDIDSECIEHRRRLQYKDTAYCAWNRIFYYAYKETGPNAIYSITPFAVYKKLDTFCLHGVGDDFRLTETIRIVDDRQESKYFTDELFNNRRLTHVYCDSFLVKLVRLAIRDSVNVYNTCAIITSMRKRYRSNSISIGY